MRRLALALVVAFGCSDGDDGAPDDLLVSLDVVGIGLVISSPEGLECSTSCSAKFPRGASLEISGIAPPGSIFLGFSGACSGRATCTIDVERNLEITATFAKSIAPIEVIVEGSGLVQSSPDGISCRDRCTREYQSGDQVVLEAIEDPGFRFAGWSGACSGTEDCRIDVERGASVVALFVPDGEGATLQIEVVGPGAVNFGGLSCTGICARAFPSGTVVEMIAAADPNGVFIGWGGECAGATDSACTIEVSGDVTVQARFEERGEVELTVLKNGMGTGNVVSDDMSIDCGQVCSATFPFGTPVELTPQPDPGSIFDGWLDCPLVASDICYVDAGDTPSVTASFGLAGDRSISVNVVGPGNVVSTPAGINCPAGACSASFTGGQSVVLEALAQQASNFWRWEGDCTGTDPTGCLLVVDRSRQVTARFGDACNLWSVGSPITAPSDPRMNATTALTVEAWVYSIAGIPAVVAARSNTGEAECAFEFEVTGDSLEFCVFSGCVNTEDSICTSTPFTDALPRWRHLAAVFEAPGSLRIYLDGAQPGNTTTVVSGNFTGALAAIAQPFRSNAQGYVASMRLSNDALYNQTFIPENAPPPLPSDIFNWQIEEGMGTVLFDSTQNGINGTVAGAPWEQAGPGCP